MVDVFRALGDPHRLAIIRAAMGRECHVQSLADELGITQPAVSRHVRLLKAAGLLQIERQGRRSVLRCPPSEPTPVVRRVLSWIAESDGGIPPQTGAVRAIRPQHRRDDIEDYLL